MAMAWGVIQKLQLQSVLLGLILAAYMDNEMTFVSFALFRKEKRFARLFTCDADFADKIFNKETGAGGIVTFWT